MNAIPEDRLKLLKPSPLYMGEINSPGQPTLNDLKRIEQNAIGSCKLLSKDEILWYRNRFSKVYEPLILSKSSQEAYRTLGDCAWDCAWEQYGSALDISNSLIISGLIPKKLVGIPSKALGPKEKRTIFTSIPSLIQHRYPNTRIPLPSWINGKTFKQANKVRQTAGVLRFVGRIIPGIGWVLFAADVALITLCVNKCMNSKKQKIDKPDKPDKPEKPGIMV
ncbi:hypothetical protein [Commensalibacter nepenthis]|uniref:Uncharacterized protein n=1 Tax=Commensalibacter nepenthis TaxID=3043872 RepID=A0ABT6QAM9_9PROT|nr:hypothetical protein [Commensalibacter sp. TBRC 10068]MDI2113963.1 hypothetical protein [Commensalibacter sp. TBRC 10068]